MNDLGETTAAFIEAACVPLDAGHASGTIEAALSILAANPEIATRSIHAASVLGDAAVVRRFLDREPGLAVSKGGPRNWDALTHLCFSRFLRLDPSRSEGFVKTATILLDAGASANTGWFENNHQPAPEFESVLYGAAGVAHHAGLTRLLLERGADPNDDEVAYHAPEGWDNQAFKILVESRKLTPESLAVMLVRKHDWHDMEGIRCLLEHGADPNWRTRWGRTALHQAVLRDNALEIVGLSLDHGANPTLTADGRSAIAMAARRGRRDLLDLFERRGFQAGLEGVEKLIAACARADAERIRSIAGQESGLVRELVGQGGRLLAEFAGVGNTEGVRHLLDLGVPADARFEEGDGYWEVATNSTALHLAAWRARHATVALLIARGAPVNATDGAGRTPLALAVRACVNSYWTERRSPESVRALLEAGASRNGVPIPCGYAPVDELLRG